MLWHEIAPTARKVDWATRLFIEERRKERQAVGFGTVRHGIYDVRYDGTVFVVCDMKVRYHTV